MMQERFKFRVWWKKEKCWVESMMLCNLGFLAMQNGTDIEDEGFDEKDLVIQQSTGLKDKNGKLIYEGDIVQYDFGKNNSYINGIVKGKVFWNKTKWDIDCCFFDLEDYIPEIIGNIYENKELLKEQKC